MVSDSAISLRMLSHGITRKPSEATSQYGSWNGSIYIYQDHTKK